ncbi:glycosyltransferase family 1 protein [Sporolactobacillus sp. THM7-4]|nr:glycosyltransferase family 1 protein [Sporolactobacillus sp. THM7-4]
MKVAIVTAGTLPVPAVRGGAVEALVEGLAKENEHYCLIELVIISVFDSEAEKQARRYPHTRFIFIRPGAFIEALDRCVYFIATKLFKKKKGTASYRNLFRRLYLLFKTTRILNKETFDRVVLENSATLFRALKGKKNWQKYERKYFFHIHNKVTGSYGCTKIIQGCKTMAVSNYINQTFPKFMQAIPKRNRRVLRNGINIKQFTPEIRYEERDRLRRRFGLEVDDLVLLFVGRLTPEKGIKELLKAFRKIELPHVKLLIAGSPFFDSGLKSSFENQIRKLSETMSDRVIFTGFIPYPEMPSLYAIADLAVMPSIWEEPAGLTMVEAMASGLPLVTTSSGGIPEYVNEGCAVLLPRDGQIVERLTEALRALIFNPDMRKVMAERGQYAAQKMGLDRYYLDFIQAISDREAAGETSRNH